MRQHSSGPLITIRAAPVPAPTQEHPPEEKEIFTPQECRHRPLYATLPSIYSRQEPEVRWPPVHTNTYCLDTYERPTPCGRRRLSTLSSVGDDTALFIWHNLSGTQEQELAGRLLGERGWVLEPESHLWYKSNAGAYQYYEPVQSEMRQASNLPPALLSQEPPRYQFLTPF